MPIDTAISRVMVIDDDDISNFLCKKVIGIYSSSAAIDTYTNPQLALDYLVKNKDKPALMPDLIMLDINMPIISGWEFLHRCREKGVLNNNQTRIVILSSSVYQKDKEKAESYTEVVGFISKPLTLDRYKEMQLLL